MEKYFEWSFRLPCSRFVTGSARFQSGVSSPKKSCCGRSRLWRDSVIERNIGWQTPQHHVKDLARRRQGLCGLFCGCLIGITRIAELPGILGERRRPAKQRVQAAIDLATRFSQFDQVVRFAERNAMPRQERFQRFLRSLLSVKDN